MVTYLDRVCIATTAPAMMQELGISPLRMGMVFSVFVLGYVLFEIPGGWMGDRFGARAVLTRIVVWWSVFTAATAHAWNFRSLVVIRFLFGAGEAGAFPNCASVIARWFPPGERGRAQGLILTGTRLGGAFAPALVVTLMTLAGWRSVFWIFACLGLVWAVIWFGWYRNSPAEHPSVGQKELLEIAANGPPTPARSGPVRWAVLLRSRNIWALSGMYVGYTFGLYFYLTWLPTYLMQARGVSLATLGVWAGLPLLAGAASNVAGGFLTDALARRAGLRWGRRIPGGLGLFLAAAFLLLSVQLESHFAALIAMVASFACADLLLGPAWATCLDIGKQHAGTVSGCMNSFGQIGGLMSPIVFGWVVETWGSWTLPLLLTTGLYLLSSALWLVIDPEAPLALVAGVGAGQVSISQPLTPIPDVTRK